jgi:hypothetical protein
MTATSTPVTRLAMADDELAGFRLHRRVAFAGRFVGGDVADPNDGDFALGSDLLEGQHGLSPG